MSGFGHSFEKWYIARERTRLKAYNTLDMLSIDTMILMALLVILLFTFLVYTDAPEDVS